MKRKRRKNERGKHSKADTRIRTEDLLITSELRYHCAMSADTTNFISLPRMIMAESARFVKKKLRGAFSFQKRSRTS